MEGSPVTAVAAASIDGPAAPGRPIDPEYHWQAMDMSVAVSESFGTCWTFAE
jgi:hypothetical protein